MAERSALRPRALPLAAGLAAIVAAAAQAAPACRNMTFEGERYTICQARFGQDDLRIWQEAPDGLPVGTFERLAGLLAGQGKAIGFAMNAGMYAPDRRPLGLTIIAGKEVAPLVTGAGPGNFGMLPNGVFCIGPDRYRIVETRAFAAAPPDCRYATQSGPMLVIHGKLHPRFLIHSTSLYIRNGVGVSADGRRAEFAISAAPVSFHAFARLFRDGLKLPAALFLDGSISRLDAPGLGREDGGLPMGPILGTAVDAAAPSQ
jgi:uncharacterized protein YigE (DUF2233 family)